LLLIAIKFAVQQLLFWPSSSFSKQIEDDL
jgi:hypothetical protein